MSEKEKSGTLRKMHPGEDLNNIITNFVKKSIANIVTESAGQDWEFIASTPFLRNGTTLLYGLPGLGKSRLALALSQILILNGINVFYINFENARIFSQDKGHLRDFFLNAAQEHKFIYAIPDTDVFGYKLLELAAQTQYFIVVDSFEAIVTDTSKDVEVMRFFQIWREHGCKGLIIHHPRKLQRGEEFSTFRGSMKIMAFTDVMAELRKSEFAGEETKMYIHIVKHRPVITSSDFIISIDNEGEIISVNQNLTPTDIRLLRKAIAYLEKKKQDTLRNVEKTLHAQSVLRQLFARYREYFLLKQIRKNSYMVSLNMHKIDELKEMLNFVDMPKKRNDPDLTF